MNRTTRFSKNWNNKLDCEFFTTVRYWSNQYRQGDLHDIELNGQYVKTCKVLGLITCKLEEIGPLVTYPDAGLSPEDFREMMRKMYQNKPTPPDEADFVVVLFKTVAQKGGVK